MKTPKLGISTKFCQPQNIFINNKPWKYKIGGPTVLQSLIATTSDGFDKFFYI